MGINFYIIALLAFLSPFISSFFLLWYISRRSPKKDAFSPIDVFEDAISVGILCMLCFIGVHWLIMGTVTPVRIFTSMELLARYALFAIVFATILYCGLAGKIPKILFEIKDFAVTYRYDHVMVGATLGLGYGVLESMLHMDHSIEHYDITLESLLLMFFYLEVFLMPMYILCGMSAGYHYAHYKFDGEAYPHARKAAFIEPAFIFLTYHFLAYYFWTNYYVNSNQDTGLIFLLLLVACFVWWYIVTRKRSNKMLELDKEIVDSEPIVQETETDTINQEQENK